MTSTNEPPGAVFFGHLQVLPSEAEEGHQHQPFLDHGVSLQIEMKVIKSGAFRMIDLSNQQTKCQYLL